MTRRSAILMRARSTYGGTRVVRKSRVSWDPRGIPTPGTQVRGGGPWLVELPGPQRHYVATWADAIFLASGAMK